MYSEIFAPEARIRQEKIQEALRNAEVDALLLADNANLYYTAGRVFSGYTYIPVEGDMLYFVRRPVGLAGGNVIYIRKPEQIVGELQNRELKLPVKLMLEGDSLSFNEYNRIVAAFAKVSTAVSPQGTSIIRAVRSVKTPYEIALIRRSATIHDAMYRRVPRLYTEGMTDVEFSIELEREARRHGSLGIFRIFGRSMEIYMGSLLTGDNADNPSPYDFAMGGAGIEGSLPVSCNGSPIRPGQTVMVDMNGNFTGYMSDLSRVFSVGKISSLAQKAHQVSIRIHRAVVEAARPGVSASLLYNIALEIVKQEDLDSYFMGHRQKAGFVGHGVGIEVNELPVLSPRSLDILQEGMTIALEPKFVIPGVGAVGIEDTYLVTESGIERLTLCPEEILPLDNFVE